MITKSNDLVKSIVRGHSRDTKSMSTRNTLNPLNNNEGARSAKSDHVSNTYFSFYWMMIINSQHDTIYPVAASHSLEFAIISFFVEFNDM